MAPPITVHTIRTKKMWDFQQKTLIYGGYTKTNQPTCKSKPKATNNRIPRTIDLTEG